MENSLDFYQVIDVKKKFSNNELLFFQFFHDKTEIFAKNIILIEDYIFIFLDGQDYFKGKKFIPFLRKIIRERKIVIVREEKTLIKLVFGLFPDPYIHDVKMIRDSRNNKVIITVLFLSFKERGIAVGSGGRYIKAINRILEDYLRIENNGHTIYKIRCVLEDHYN